MMGHIQCTLFAPLDYCYQGDRFGPYLIGSKSGPVRIELFVFKSNMGHGPKIGEFKSRSKGDIELKSGFEFGPLGLLDCANCQ